MHNRFAALFLFALCFATSAAAQVLLLYTERSELPAIHAIDVGVREALAARGGVEVFAEHFDFARFPAQRNISSLIELLRTRYGAMKLDMVITTGNEALEFALAQRDALFPGVPITYCGIERQHVTARPLPPDVSGVLLSYDFRRTVELALKLQPDVREAVCVFGTSDFDRQVGEEALAALAEHPELRVRQLDALPYAGILEQLRQLPAKSMVLYASVLRDAAGQARPTLAFLDEVCTASSAPVYGVAAHFLDRGFLGGAMLDFSAHGREIGAIAVARLDGQATAPRDPAPNPLLINWRALKKWGVAESRVPAEAIVRFKPPSLWREHRGIIIGVLVVVALQSALIAGLLVNRATRRRAERALAESTERMSLAADAAKLGMWVWDVSGNDAWMTEQGRALFGFKPDARIDYAALLDRVHPEDRAAREAAIKRALETQGEYELEYRVQPPDGEVRWISARGRCVGTANGKGPKLLGVSMDVTARKLAELEAAQQRAELGHLSRVALVGEMATSLAHELNQPLTAIVTNASAAQRFIARDDMDPAELREMLEDIAADGHRAGEVIRGIKGMVRKVESERRALDVNEVIADVLRLVRADALAHGCTLANELDPALPPILGDAVQLQQVLLNLIINAFDAMRKTPCHTCRVEIASRRADAKTVEVSVRDFGPGLPADTPLRIFERFFSTKSEGMGMGLAIARSIIEAHEGILGAANAEGGGARFWFRVPAQIAASTEASA
jgi:PAS domain S-box-containing protein